VTGPRAVRIVRPRPAEPGSVEEELRPNRAGTQRAVRTATLFSIAVLALTAVLSAIDLASPEGSHPAVRQGLELFLGLAVLLLVGSALFALGPAPRALLVRADRVVVIGRWGRRRVLGSAADLAPRVLRHFPEGFLSNRPVDMVEVSDLRGRRRVYQVESGLFDRSNPVPFRPP
jgi:hypothetical protein